MSSAVSLGGGEQRSKTGLSKPQATSSRTSAGGRQPPGPVRTLEHLLHHKSVNITMQFCRRCSAGSLGESSLDFESMVEEVRRFVARMPPADSTTGSGCCPWSF
jgi:hypothetical protein